MTVHAPTSFALAAILAVVVQAGCGGSPAPAVAAPTGLGYTGNPAVYRVGTAIGANAPHSSGGAVVSYTVSPSLPAGLVLDAVTGVLSGTPTAIAAQASYTVTATNQGGKTTCALVVTVTDAPPTQLVYGMPQATYTKGIAIPANVPSSAGGAVTRYIVSPALPAGLAIDSATGVISGTPTVSAARFSYTVTASNSGGSTTAQVEIKVEDSAPGPLAYAANPATYYLNASITPNAPSSAGGGITTYRVSPALPAGLLLNAATGVITGTPLVTSQGTFRVTANNSGGSVSCDLFLTVIALPPAFTYVTNPLIVTKGLAMTPDQPVSTGGPIVSYGVAPPLPAGLSLDPATGIISGTPGAITATAAYVVTASNTGGSSTANLTLTVRDQAPAILAYATNPSSYTIGVTIQPDVPTNTGGVITSYSISPALPPGLGLDTSTGVISGTPTALSAEGTYVVTGANATGSTTCNFVTSVVAVPIDPPATPAITALAHATAGKAGYQASTQDQGTANGMGYLWTVTNGTITGGQGTPAITFTAGSVGTLGVQVKVTNLGGSAVGSAQATVEPVPAAPIFAQEQVLVGSVGVLASVPPQAGMTWQWSISGGGAISAGTGNVATYSVGQTPGSYQLSVTVQNRAGDQITASRTLSVVSNAFLPDSHSAPQRKEHTTTPLPDGRVLIVGGWDSNWVTASVSLYDPYSGTWAPTAPLATARTAHTATLLADGRVLVTGGEGSDTNLTPVFSTEIYDPATRTWSAGGAMTIERSFHSATRLADGSVLVAGGVPILSDTSFAFLDSSEVYDPASDSWSGAGTMNGRRASHTATLLPDGRVVLVGGQSQQGSVGWQRTTDIYDPGTLSWSAGTNMTGSRIGHTADLLASGKVLVAGGNGSASPASAALFDPTTNGGAGSWKPVSNNLTNGRYEHRSVMLGNGKVLVVAGRDGFVSSQEIATAELYDPATNSWSGAGTLSYSTTAHGAALLPDGKVFVFGGHNSSSSLLSSNGQIYDPAQNLWSNAGGMAWPRFTHSTTALPDGTVLVAGGTGTRGSLAAAEIFDPAAGTWSSTASLINPRAQHGASLLADGRILVTGGWASAGVISSAELYTPATKSWTGAPAMPVGRSEHTSTVLADGRVLVAGGKPSLSTLGGASAAIYDPPSNSWIAVPDMSAPRFGHQAILLASGKVLVSGGRNSGGYLGSAELFDPASNSWSSAPLMNSPRHYHTSTLLADGRVLVAGGQINSSIFTATAEIYDPAANTWTVVAPMSVARGFHAAAVLANQQIFVFGGRNGPSGPNLGTAERYDPATNAWTSLVGQGSPRFNHSIVAFGDGSVLVIGGQANSMPEVWKP